MAQTGGNSMRQNRRNINLRANTAGGRAFAFNLCRPHRDKGCRPCVLARAGVRVSTERNKCGNLRSIASRPCNVRTACDAADTTRLSGKAFLQRRISAVSIPSSQNRKGGHPSFRYGKVSHEDFVFLLLTLLAVAPVAAAQSEAISKPEPEARLLALAVVDFGAVYSDDGCWRWHGDGTKGNCSNQQGPT